MIIWNGLGFLVFVFIFGCSLAANLITNAVTGSEAYWDAHQWTFGVSLIVAGLPSWFVGRYLAAKNARTLVDKETGQEVVIQPYHAFFFIRMHWWGPILAVLGLAVVVVNVLKWGS
jgi:hypothetical protein